MKQNVKFCIQRAMKAQRGSSRHSLTLSLTSSLDGVGDERHAPVDLPSGMGPGTHFIGGGWTPGLGWTSAEPSPRFDAASYNNQ